MGTLPLMRKRLDRAAGSSPDVLPSRVRRQGSLMPVGDRRCLAEALLFLSPFLSELLGCLGRLP